MSYASTAPRVPAWKRLGLKLKGSADDSGTASPVIATSTPAPASAFSPSTRRAYPAPSSSQHQSSTPSKRREPPVSAIAQPAAKKQKSVAFADAGTAAATAVTPKKAKKPKKARKKRAEPNPANKEPSNLDRELEYLQLWKTSRETWKFNKNHQSLLIKYVFVGGTNNTGIPATHIDTFYDYISSLQGGVRTRLLAEAREICLSDDNASSNTGMATTTATTGSKDRTAASKAQTEQEAEYARIVSEFRGRSNGSAASSNNGKRPQRLCETDYALRCTEPAKQERLRRRIRAENVVNELAGDEVEAAVTLSAVPAKDTQKSTPVHPVPATTSRGSESRTKPNDGTVKKPARSRKQRTAVDSSDDSESDSDSDSSSSSSDDSNSSESDSDSDSDED
ncbi:hypothetical protein SEPCBS119000_002334 [Sporothrix epigloea]|uniref:WKF domain-containing protein n=1 Tax=Sporothrix epigloea TaxID=1892477 RepID=A0ABP0DGW5_9PEZI